MVERSTGHTLKVLHGDNDGEYLSREFAEYLESERIHHELTVLNRMGWLRVLIGH